MLTEEQIQPVLIRAQDPRYHTTLFCAFTASNEKTEKVYEQKLDGLVVTTKALAALTKKPCRSEACKGVPWYDYHEGDCIE